MAIFTTLITATKLLVKNMAKKKLKEKAKKFFDDLQIKNLKLYYDDSIKLANTFSLIGLPTTIFIDKDGDEFARIIGSVDFGDQNFIKWLSNYN